MIWATISMTFLVEGAADLDTLTDTVFEELLSLESDDVRDSDMDAALAEEVVTIRVQARGETLDDAFLLGGSVIRSAIHASGGATPGWQNPVPDGEPSSNFELQDQHLVPA